MINPATSDKLELPDLVTRGSLSLFQKLGISSKFMEKDPDTWQHCDDYCEALKVVNALTVTNDHAERGIALIQEYNLFSLIVKNRNNICYRWFLNIESNSLTVKSLH